MSDQKKCRSSLNERKKRFRENNPGYEARQKDKERARDQILRFHIARNHRYGYAIPETIDQSTDAFKRVKRLFLEECAAPVEVDEVVR